MYISYVPLEVIVQYNLWRVSSDATGNSSTSLTSVLIECLGWAKPIRKPLAFLLIASWKLFFNVQINELQIRSKYLQLFERQGKKTLTLVSVLVKVIVLTEHQAF